ncbi:MAG: hypothetical protein MJ105_02670 [Lachnospiraceae bacterium]|nr:hypothetical protein [Lachnospiraceae bacterium]
MPIVSERDWSHSKAVKREKRRKRNRILAVIFGLFDVTVLLFVAGIIAGMVRHGGPAETEEDFVKYYFWFWNPPAEEEEPEDNGPVEWGNGLSEIIDTGGDDIPENQQVASTTPQPQQPSPAANVVPTVDVETPLTGIVVEAPSTNYNAYITTAGGTLYTNQQYGSIAYDLYLPTGGGTYPVLYAFHGIGASSGELGDNSFGLWSFVKNGAARPNCIIVFPHKGKGNWKQISQSSLTNFIAGIHESVLPGLGYAPDYNRIWYYGFSQGCYDAVYNIQAFHGLVKRAVLNDGRPGNISSLGLDAVYFIEAYETVVNVPSLQTVYFSGAETAYAPFLNGFRGYVTVADLNSRGWGGGKTRSHAYANGWICAVSGGMIPGINNWHISPGDMFYDLFTWLNQSF